MENIKISESKKILELMLEILNTTQMYRGEMPLKEYEELAKKCVDLYREVK